MSHCHNQLAPVLFIGHGSPENVVLDNDFSRALRQTGQRLAKPRAILAVSAHWLTPGVRLTTAPAPEQVFDFYGFPEELYRLRYSAPGAPELAEKVAKLTGAAHDHHRGLDHGAWVPLFHLLPDAQVPVFQVSMPLSLTTAQAVDMGRALAPLRDQGVVIVGSGSMTHNLYEFRQAGTRPEAYAQEFAAWVRTAVLADAVQPLIDYRKEAPHAARAHPTEEHFLPLLVAMGAHLGDGVNDAAGNADRLQVLDGGGIAHGVLSMESYVWGQPQ